MDIIPCTCHNCPHLTGAATVVFQDNILKQARANFLCSVKWFQVLLTLIIQFDINHLFAHSWIVSSVVND